MLVTLLTISCTKEKSTTLPEVKEYFAPKETNVKEEIRNFLLAAHPNLNVANKTTTVLTDKEPNEGAWLMEAAINAERYGRLNKDVVKTKIYTLDIINKTLPNGLLRMDAVDILAKYNQLLSDIISDEIDQKIANLIDLQIIEINNDFTKIQVEVNFVYIAEPVVFEPETIILPPASASNCLYQLPTGINFPTSLSYDFTNYPVTASVIHSYQSNHIGSASWSYREMASANGMFFTTQTIPNQGLTFIFSDGSTDYTPYTNVILVHESEIIDKLSCSTILYDEPYSGVLQSEALYRFKTMSEEYTNYLPNNIYNDMNYRLVYTSLRDSRKIPSAAASASRKVVVETLGYLHISNQ